MTDDGSNRLPILAEQIKQAHAGVYDAAKTAAERAIEAGHALLEAKSLVKHGEWLPWLKQHCQLPERTAQLYMHIAKLGLESATVAELGLKAAAKAIVLEYPYPRPWEDGPEEVRREWLAFMLIGLRGQPPYSSEYVCSYCERLLRTGWESPSAWLTEEGDRYCKRGGLTGRPSEGREEWLAVLNEFCDHSFAEMMAVVEQEGKRADEWIARYGAEHPQRRSTRRRRRAA